jgi:hypothetical protein
LNDLVTISRDGKESEVKVWIQMSNHIVAPVGTDIRAGDRVTSEQWHEPHVVMKVKGTRNPFDPPGHVSVDLLPLGEWEAAQRRHGGQTTVTQNIGSAGFVAGRDMQVTITAEQLLVFLGKQIEDDPKIPEPEKKTLLQRVKDLADNPYIKAIGVTALTEWVKHKLGGG